MAGTATPIHVRYGIPIAEWIDSVANELPVDAVGLWQIVRGLRLGFDLSGEPLDRYVRLSVAKLIERGAIPVHGTSDHGCSVRSDLVGTETVERVLTYWKSLDREPDVSDLWFALPQFIAAKKR
jgi:hypothetical protein